MAVSYTLNYNWTKPQVGGSTDAWGGLLNTDLDDIDTTMKAVSTVANAAAAKANNLSDLTNAGTARTNLGVAIGTNVQAYDALLQSIAGLSFGANSYIYGTGTDTAAVGTITTFARSILDDADAATARATLGVVIGTNVQAHSGTLASLAGASANGVSLTTAADYAAMRSLLSLVPGSNVQSYNGNLAALAGLTFAVDRLPYANGSGSMALATFTAAGRDMVAAADAAAQKTLLGLSNVDNMSAAAIRGGISSGNVTAALGYTPTSITGLTGAQSVAALKSAMAITKSDVGLGNAEDKSSATIRGELTKANVDTAIGGKSVRVSPATPTTNTGLISWGSAAPGTLAEGELYLRHA